TTDKTEPVTVKIAGQESTAMPTKGNWRVQLKPLAAGGPHELVISQGDDKVTVNDVLVGDVWLCGGQSNMQWSLNATAEAKSGKDNPKIRLITIDRKGSPEPKTEINNTWTTCTVGALQGFTAVGYHFGADLEKAVNVPIGLINSNVGGTPAERWLS